MDNGSVHRQNEIDEETAQRFTHIKEAANSTTKKIKEDNQSLKHLLCIEKQLEQKLLKYKDLLGDTQVKNDMIRKNIADHQKIFLAKLSDKPEHNQALEQCFALIDKKYKELSAEIQSKNLHLPEQVPPNDAAEIAPIDLEDRDDLFVTISKNLNATRLVLKKLEARAEDLRKKKEAAEAELDGRVDC